MLCNRTNSIVPSAAVAAALRTPAGAAGSMPRRVGTAMGMGTRSFADAEAGEDRAEQIVGADRAGDRAQRLRGMAQVLGDQFR